MKVFYTTYFYRQIKKYEKKFHGFLEEVDDAIAHISLDNSVALGGQKYKSRISIASFPKGKSGSFRLLFFLLLDDIIVPITIYQKADIVNMSSSDILRHAQSIEEEIKSSLL